MQFSINKKPQTIKEVLNDDGQFPNSYLPVLIYKAALILPEEHAEKIIEDIFKINNWTNSWRNGIYDYHHYHSITHEALGVYEGNTIVQFGGSNGIQQLIEKGDIIIVPAGVAHKNIGPERDFKCVGAYSNGKDYDIKRGDPNDRPEANKNIKKVPLPENDPVYGNNGALISNWNIK
jgi:uncharacterized protein YjlB